MTKQAEPRHSVGHLLPGDGKRSLKQRFGGPHHEKIRSFEFALVAGVALAALTPAIANHSWGGYHWAGDGQNLTIRVNTATTAVWNTSVTDAIADWNQSTELTLNRASSSADPKRCNPIAGQILVCNASYGKRGWLGIASIWLT